MRAEQKELIQSYMNIDKEIKDTERRLMYKKKSFYAQNFYGKTEFNAIRIQSKGFRVDSRVAGYVDLCNTLERQIEVLERKKMYFNRFMRTLPNEVLSSLNRRYKVIDFNMDNIQSMGSDRKVLDEILEIEEAISFQFGMKDNPDFLKMKQLENVELTEETVEDSFENMLELLGV